jgi:hypothetical protein
LYQRRAWTCIGGHRLVSEKDMDLKNGMDLYQRSTCFESGSDYCCCCEFRGFTYSNISRINLCNEKALDLYVERAGANLVQVTRTGV